MEKKISNFVKHRKKIPNFIHEEAKIRVKLAKMKNEYLPYEKPGKKLKGSYIECVAASKEESFYYLHKQKMNDVNCTKICEKPKD